MFKKGLTLAGQAKWFHWAALVGFGLVAGLLIIIVINTRAHPTGNQEMEQVKARVSRHVILPTDETPALATVTDPAKLKNNQFLSKGRKGDKLLIYSKWQRAVLYRPSTDRVVDIGPVDVSPPGGDTNGYNPISK